MMERAFSDDLGPADLEPADNRRSRAEAQRPVEAVAKG